MATTAKPGLALGVRDLWVHYRKAEALAGVTMEVREGQIVTVIGPNGAGKSTLVNAVMGALPEYCSVRGHIESLGHEIIRDELEHRVALGLSLVPERRELFSSMSVEDNLRLGAYLRRRERSYLDQLPVVYKLFPRLQERSRQEAGTLSGGERQMLAIGRALMAKPRVLMLDEPSLGLAPLITKDIFRIVLELKAMGVSTLLIEQNARAALKVADYGYVLEGGSITMHGPAEELAVSEKVIEGYLGVARPEELGTSRLS